MSSRPRIDRAFFSEVSMLVTVGVADQLGEVDSEDTFLTEEIVEQGALSSRTGGREGGPWMA